MSTAPRAKFKNFYRCPKCGKEWEDEWDSTCNDECMSCGTSDIEPYKSEDIPDALYDKIINSAQRHGEESEPDHEVGDLQQALQAALDIMTETQRNSLEKHLTEQDFFEEAL
jgi:predicted  nucleic acid-binding Zn-ribbon protein